MRLSKLRLSGFQCFAPEPAPAVEIDFDDLTVFVGLNGAGKTAVMTALTRMFGVDRRMRGLRPADFFADLTGSSIAASSRLWIEVDFCFPELKEQSTTSPAVPPHFRHMMLLSPDTEPILRVRLQGELDSISEIDESLCYVVMADITGQPTRVVPVRQTDRNQIHVHYVPAARDPNSHITYAPSSLLGRLLHAAQWSDEHREGIREAGETAIAVLADHAALKAINAMVAACWGKLHKGNLFQSPQLSFLWGDIEHLLRQVTLVFSPSESAGAVEFERLSDGQRSLLHIALVYTVLCLEEEAIAQAGPESQPFIIDRLRPPAFTLLALEEPENHLAPHYLGRIVSLLSEIAAKPNAQVVLSSHSGAILRRIEPRQIRYMRLVPPGRTAAVHTISLPRPVADGYKYVREAIQAFPELYFARLVVLGEGDSEEIVLPKILHSAGHEIDDSFVSVVPLGGRHVNHFWRLLHELEVSFLTLLDLDCGRYGGGWGRIRYAAKQLLEYRAALPFTAKEADELPKWNSANDPLCSEEGLRWLGMLEAQGVFFSAPLDLDFMMLDAFRGAYGIVEDETEPVDNALLAAVLGERNVGARFYSAEQLTLFRRYRTLFKGKSKPASHLEALASLDAEMLMADLPETLRRLLHAIKDRLKDLPE